ncbi:MAG: hypothetical protein QOJ58_1983 [Alphaproteobacteria bacterium]|nr:hypothetical protein [Alphaproteobacteria bacterium]
MLRHRIRGGLCRLCRSALAGHTGRDAVLEGEGLTFDEIAAARNSASAASSTDLRGVTQRASAEDGETGEDWVRLCEPLEPSADRGGRP